MKKIKQILSILLMCCLVAGMLPITVMATDVLASGTCGDNLTWTLDSSGALTISGTGAMTNYSTYTAVPWYHIRSEIEVAIIEEGVTTIGRWAFNHCSIESISIPNSVTSIEDYAFYWCGLSNIVIPNSVRYIGIDAFWGNSFSTVEIPDGITSISEGAFAYCSELENIVIPDTVVSIGVGAFGGSAYIKNESNWENGVLYLGKVLVDTNSNLPSNYTIKAGTKTIGRYAFSRCNNLKNVVIPNSVTRIEESAFEYCVNLESINIPESVTYFGVDTFYGCRNLITAIISANVTDIPSSMFEACNNLMNVVISDTVTCIGNLAFWDCESLTKLIIPDNVVSVGYYAFSGCNGLEQISIPESVVEIGDGAFLDCNKLSDVYFSGSKEQWEKITIGDYQNYNAPLFNATIHYNSTGPDDVDPTPEENTSTSVRFLSNWDDTTRQVTFGYSEVISPCTYTVADDVDVANIDQLLNKYVLVTMEQGDSVLEYTVTDIQPVESAIGEVTAMGEHSLTIDGTEYPVREDYILGTYDGQEILYHTYNGTIMDYSLLEEKSGTLEGWNSTTGRVTINGTEYPTNFLTDMSFLGHIEEYLGENVTYFVSGDDSYRPLIRIDGVVEVENEIAVFSTEKSLTVKTGDSMWLGFGKIADGEIVGDWKRMAIVVSDPTVISLSEYEETEYGYSLEVTGKKQGATNVTITDTESGAHTIIVITVRDSYVGTYSYAIDNMETFYPNNEWEGSVQTNIYNLNGLYVNNYQESKTGAAYTVSFDVYNSQYHTGAVDIYDADGNWIDCEEIKKFSMISSLWDTGEQAYYLISDAVSGKLLTYEQASFAEHTSISIEVPDGGYFTISNNFAESPGAFLFNSCEILYDGTCTVIDAALDVKNDKVALSAFSDLVKSEITKDKTIREQFIDIFKKTAKKEAQKCLKKFAINEIDDRYADISGLFENLLNSLDISWKHLFKSATGVGESAFTKFAGPAGVALKGCFAFTKGGNQLVQAVHLAASIDAPYVTVFSSIDEGSINPHGVIVNTNGNIDAEAELHVFRVSNDDTIEVVLNESGDDHLKKYELYNICFVKNDQLVQPSGKVTVRIPIPDGMKGDTCCVYRQESDGTWTILTAHIEGNYLVFETDHFSLYGIVGDVEELGISSLPTKTLYNVGDILDPDGLVLSLGDKLITDGFICEPTVLAQSGIQNITVRYGIAFTEFAVSVQANTDGDSSGGGSTGGGSQGGGSSDNSTPTPPDSTDSNHANSQTPTISFADVPTDAYYYDAVYWAVANGITNGTGDGTTFSPNAACTRGQAVTLLWRAAGSPTPKSANMPFTDVKTGAYYYDAVLWAVENGVTKGTGKTTFSPDDTCTRAQIVTFLYRTLGTPEAGGANPFMDVADNAYYTDAVLWAVEKGVTKGTSKTAFSPDDDCTRAQIVTFLYRSYQSN